MRGLQCNLDESLGAPASAVHRHSNPQRPEKGSLAGCCDVLALEKQTQFYPFTAVDEKILARTNVIPMFVSWFLVLFFRFVLF